MLELIKKAVLRLFPELAAGLHLDRYARVTAVNDAPASGSASERFRPRYSVDLTVLTADLQPDPAYPVYSAVPLPLALGGGQESGLYAFPQPGALAVIAFAYGRPDHPVIRQLYPLGATLPAVGPGEILIQREPEVFQRADATGGWQRRARGGISDSSAYRRVEARLSECRLGSESREVTRNSLTQVGGVCGLKAGLLDALGALKVDIGSLGEANITAGTDGTFSAGGKLGVTVGGDLAEKVGGGRSSEVTGGDSLKAAAQTVHLQGEQSLQAAAVKQIVQGAHEVQAASITASGSGAVLLQGATVTLASAAGVIALGGGGGGGDPAKDVFKELVNCLEDLIAADSAMNPALTGAPASGAIAAASGHLANIKLAIS